MMISVGLSVLRLFPFAVAPVKVIGLKWASGSTPVLEEGASAMTSADELASLPDAWIVWVQPLVVSLRTRV